MPFTYLDQQPNQTQTPAPSTGHFTYLDTNSSQSPQTQSPTTTPTSSNAPQNILDILFSGKGTIGQRAGVIENSLKNLPGASIGSGLGQIFNSLTNTGENAASQNAQVTNQNVNNLLKVYKTFQDRGDTANADRIHQMITSETNQQPVSAEGINSANGYNTNRQVTGDAAKSLITLLTAGSYNPAAVSGELSTAATPVVQGGVQQFLNGQQGNYLTQKLGQFAGNALPAGAMSAASTYQNGGNIDQIGQNALKSAELAGGLGVGMGVAGDIANGTTGLLNNLGSTLAKPLGGLTPSPSQITRFENLSGTSLPDFVAQNKDLAFNPGLVDQKIQPLQEAFDSIARDSNLKVNPQDVKTAFEDQINTLADSTVKADRNTAAALQDNLNAFTNKFGNKPIDVADLTAARVAHDAQLTPAAWAANPQDYNLDRTTRNIFQEAIQNAADKAGLVGPDGQSLQQIGQQLNPLYTFKNLIADPQAAKDVASTARTLNLGKLNSPLGAAAGMAIFNGLRTRSLGGALEGAIAGGLTEPLLSNPVVQNNIGNRLQSVTPPISGTTANDLQHLLSLIVGNSLNK